MADRLDAWIHGGTLTRTSLARYRVLYAVVVLLLLPDFSWIAAFPDSMYNPPPGPMMLFSGFPSEAVLRALEAALAVCLVAILLGWHTRAASFLSVAVSMIGYGFTYCLGKIDHDILVVLVPAALALAGWGDRLSLDAVRRRSLGETDRPERAVQWPLRLWALMIGLAFFTAALPKIAGGWLNPLTHAVQGISIRQFYTHDRADLLADTFQGINNPVFWELMDIATILLEAGILLAVLSWGGTRVAFAIATLFHLGVWLMMNIPFWHNVVTYGFVVAWDRVPVPQGLRRSFSPAPGLVRAAPAMVVAAGIAWSVVIESFGNAAGVMYPVVLVAGALVASGYLALLGVRAVRSLRKGVEEASGRLIYDADCGFCTRSARWLAGRHADRIRIIAWQAIPDLAALGLREDDVNNQAYWQGESGTLKAGSEAIAAAMVARGGPAVAVGRLIASRAVAPVAASVYRWVAAHRHQMPGSTDACRLPAPSGPAKARPPTRGTAPDSHRS